MKYILIFIVSLTSSIIYGQYSPDLLGGDYLKRTIKCKPDVEGEVTATLIKKPQSNEAKVAILYVHGYCDYFFQKHLGDSLSHIGLAFYAIDLRKYGRSFLPHQTRFDTKNLKEYHEEIDSAINIIKAEGYDQLLLLGHSTGGLIVSHYYLHHQDKKIIKGLILNSPFLDFNLNRAIENLGVDIISLNGKNHPDKKVSQKLNANYGESLHKKYKGIWDYNLQWKPIISPAVNQGWIRAIHSAQKELLHVNFELPILLLSSDRSYKKSKWTNDIKIMDAVLDVKDIERIGTKLGSQVTYKKIPEGKHDLVLSNEKARILFFEEVKNWLSQNKLRVP